MSAVAASPSGASSGAGAGGSGAGGNGGGSGGGTGGSTGPCGACKFLRRKCVHECIFAPYFDSEQGSAHFAAVHKVFGASNVSKLLLHIPPHKRLDAVVTICYEAQARLRDPVYGCVAHIFALQQQVMNLQTELTYLQAHLASLEVPVPTPPPPQVQQLQMPPALTIADLPMATSVPATYDLSTLFDPTVHPSWGNTLQQQRPHLDPRLFIGTAPGGSSVAAATSSELQALARDLFNRQGSPPLHQGGSHPGMNASLSPPTSK